MRDFFMRIYHRLREKVASVVETFLSHIIRGLSALLTMALYMVIIAGIIAAFIYLGV